MIDYLDVAQKVASSPDLATALGVYFDAAASTPTPTAPPPGSAALIARGYTLRQAALFGEFQKLLPVSSRLVAIKAVDACVGASVASVRERTEFETFRAALADPAFASVVLAHVASCPVTRKLVSAALSLVLCIESPTPDQVAEVTTRARFAAPAQTAVADARAIAFAIGGGNTLWSCDLTPAGWPAVDFEWLSKVCYSPATKKVALIMCNKDNEILLLRLVDEGKNDVVAVTNILTEHTKWFDAAEELDVSTSSPPIKAVNFARFPITYSGEAGRLLIGQNSNEVEDVLSSDPKLNDFKIVANFGDLFAYDPASVGGRPPPATPRLSEAARAALTFDRTLMVARIARLLGLGAAHPKFLRGHRLQKVWWVIHTDRIARCALKAGDLSTLGHRVLRAFGLDGVDQFASDPGYWGRVKGADTADLVRWMCLLAVHDTRDATERARTPVADPRFNDAGVPIEPLIDVDLVQGVDDDPEAGWEKAGRG